MKAEIGTVIHGTFRSEDLIPAFADELELLDEQKKFVSLVKEANKFKDWEDCEECCWLIERLWDALSEFAPEGCYFGTTEGLWDALSEFAPEGCYFGTTEGDGSDFGFWPCEDF